MSSLQNAFDNCLANINEGCKDFDYETGTAPAQAKRCHGWITTDFDTVHECPYHHGPESYQWHPDYSPDEAK